MLTNAAYSTILSKNLEDAQLMNSTGFFFFWKNFCSVAQVLNLWPFVLSAGLIVYITKFDF